MRELLAPLFMKRFATTSFAFIMLALVLNAAGDPAPGLETIRADALKGHIFFLASDAMAGRDSMSREGASPPTTSPACFYRAGLEPVGDSNTFFQNFPMVDAHIDREHACLAAPPSWRESGGAIGSRLRQRSGLHHAAAGQRRRRRPRRWCSRGYGVTVRRVRLRRLQGRVDVAGKVIMILAHEPQETDPASRFKGAWNTVHAYNWWKPEVARRHGAAAMLMVQDRVNHRPPRAISGPDQRPDSHRAIRN